MLKALHLAEANATLLSMKFKEYYKGLTASQKRTLAERLHTSPEYLSQICSGHRFAGLKLVRSIQPATRGKVKYHELPMKPLDDALTVSF